jgi:hypothetical protein
LASIAKKHDPIETLGLISPSDKDTHDALELIGKVGSEGSGGLPIQAINSDPISFKSGSHNVREALRVIA